MADFLAQVQLGKLCPVDDIGREYLAKKHGRTVKVSVSEPRNLGHHRKFFAMLQIILDNQEHYKSKDELLGVCKLRIGHVVTVQTKHGVERWPATINWAQMDQAAFDDFYSRAVAWVAEEVIPGLSLDMLNAEVAETLRSF